MEEYKKMFSAIIEKYKKMFSVIVEKYDKLLPVIMEEYKNGFPIIMEKYNKLLPVIMEHKKKLLSIIIERKRKIISVVVIVLIGFILFPKIHMLVSKDYRDAVNKVERPGYSLVGTEYIKQDNLEWAVQLSKDPTSPCYQEDNCDPVSKAREKGLHIVPKLSLCTGIHVMDTAKMKNDLEIGNFKEGVLEEYRWQRGFKFTLTTEAERSIRIDNIMFYANSGSNLAIEDHTVRGFHMEGGYTPPTPHTTLPRNTWALSEIPNNNAYYEYTYLSSEGSKYPFTLGMDDVRNFPKNAALVVSNFSCVYIIPLNPDTKISSSDEQKILSDANEYMENLLLPKENITPENKE